MQEETVRIVKYAIYLNHKRIDEAWFDIWEYPKHVREVLVLDGFDPAIKIRRTKEVCDVREGQNGWGKEPKKPTGQQKSPSGGGA